MKKAEDDRLVIGGIILVLILILALIACGCIEVGGLGDEENAVESVTTAPTQRAGGDIPRPGFPQSFQAHPTEPAPVVTYGNTGGSVSDAMPIPPSDALNITPLHATRLVDTPLQVPGDYPSQEIFRKTYDLNYENAGLLVNIEKAPLIIDIHVEPECDNPYDCFLRLTVRDNATMEIIADEGYGVLYNTGAYGTGYVEKEYETGHPGDRYGRGFGPLVKREEYATDADQRIVIRVPGEYHVNLYGTRMKVTISISSGTGGIWYTPSPTPTPAVSREEELMRFRYGNRII